MKRYYKGNIHTDTVKAGSAKAICVSVDDGRWTSDRNGHMWIARSLCQISAPNDVGWCEITVPEWIFTRDRIDHRRIREISWTGVIVK